MGKSLVFELPKGNRSRNYKLVKNDDGKEVLNGSLKDLKALFKIEKSNTIVKDTLKKVSTWAEANGCAFTINGKSFSEMYPAKVK